MGLLLHDCVDNTVKAIDQSVPTPDQSFQQRLDANHAISSSQDLLLQHQNSITPMAAFGWRPGAISAVIVSLVLAAFGHERSPKEVGIH